MATDGNKTKQPEKCICKYVKANATITKSTDTYKDNKRTTVVGSVDKGERVCVYNYGSTIARIEYGISEEQYAVACIPNSCVKLD